MVIPLPHGQEAPVFHGFVYAFESGSILSVSHITPIKLLSLHLQPKSTFCKLHIRLLAPFSTHTKAVYAHTVLIDYYSISDPLRLVRHGHMYILNRCNVN